MELKLKHFSPSEFTMDGAVVFDKMNREFLLKLDHLRSACGFPFEIASSWRSLEKNKAVGGSPSSYHLQGRAVDIICTSNVRRWIIAREAMKLNLSIGIMPNAVHIDDRPASILFHYYEKFRPAKSKEE